MLVHCAEAVVRTGLRLRRSFLDSVRMRRAPSDRAGSVPSTIWTKRSNPRARCDGASSTKHLCLSGTWENAWSNCSSAAPSEPSPSLSGTATEVTTRPGVGLLIPESLRKREDSLSIEKSSTPSSALMVLHTRRISLIGTFTIP